VETLANLLSALAALPVAEWRRRTVSLHHAVALARADAAGRPKRTATARQQLRRVIAAVDARMPGGPNCVRRSLMEMSLDAGAARELLHAGLRRGGGPGSGHAWLKSQPVSESYDVVISV
jgi:hypothetical protein